MGVILGIDIGGSSTKIVGLAPDLSVIDMLRVKADDPLTSLYGAMGNFLSTHNLQLSDIRHIALTGVGSSYVEGDIYGVKTIKVEEFPSVGVGGGTLAGLSSLTTGVHQYALIRKLCQDGDLSHIDLTMADLSREQVGDLPPEATAANFAKVADDATPSDKMLGIVNLVLQSIGTMSVLACKCCGTDTVVLTGALTMLPPARETFELFKQLYHVNFIIPENATFATAIGAALYSVREN